MITNKCSCNFRDVFLSWHLFNSLCGSTDSRLRLTAVSTPAHLVLTAEEVGWREQTLNASYLLSFILFFTYLQNSCQPATSFAVVTAASWPGMVPSVSVPMVLRWERTDEAAEVSRFTFSSGHFVRLTRAIILSGVIQHFMSGFVWHLALTSQKLNKNLA